MPLVWAIGVIAALPSVAPLWAADPPNRPNIVYILADDLGYGDVRCLNPEGKIATPNLDRLAARGRIFTDAHSGSAVCTPTRYGILTGRYAWRTRLAGGVLGGYSPPLIAADRLTVASLLKRHGYHTACVGKWHLGFDWAAKAPAEFGDAIDPAPGSAERVDYARPFTRGPLSVGFDRYHGISASLDMPPYVFLIDDRAETIPTAERTYIRKGPAAPDFEAVNVLPNLVREAVAYIGERAAAKTPFFLYLPLNSPHTPIVPSPEFQGRSGLNAYADFTMQTDAAIGEVLDALKRHGLEENTLVIATSDNGCSPQANFAELAKFGHNPSHRFRGHKADIYEGGHRIPFLARWPGQIPEGTTCDQTICLTDLLATCAAIVGAELPPNAGEDSVNLLPALLGQATDPLREATVHHSINGSFAIRQGPWKLALCPGSGGWSFPRPGRDRTEGLPPVQLFNLERDIGETTNLQAEHPEIVERLTALLDRYVAEGRSTPGPRQANDRPVTITITK
jgi:arylsulfatase A-like enzyme